MSATSPMEITSICCSNLSHFHGVANPIPLDALYMEKGAILTLSTQDTWLQLNCFIMINLAVYIASICFIY